MAVKRTPEQEAVVKNRGGGLLVSAAAGSGKTRVLVERLLDRVIHEGRDLNEFLIITFTRAAAEELRSRIAKELAEAIAQEPENAHLRRQTALLYETQISTIHAFCTVLLRQWGHLLDLPVDFTLCEDEESAVLMGRAMDQVLESRYEEITEGSEFAQLLDVLSDGRDDTPLMTIALEVYAKTQSHPDPIAWLEEQRGFWDLTGITDAGETPWGKLLLEDTADTAEYWAGQMELALDLAQGDEVLEKAYGSSLATTAEDLWAFAKGARAGWDQGAALDVTFPRFSGAKGVQDVEAQNRIKAIREKCQKAVKGMKKQLASPSAVLLEDMALVRPAMNGLITLVEDFSQVYDGMKREKSLLDFADLEHCAVKLLVGPQGEPTELARQWGSQYAEIMVDEYQDTNQVQNTIFAALSEGGKNLFMVGDVKQSIYRFRLADPTIFLEKSRTFVPWDQAKEGENRKITMSRNFRSRPQVLEAVNDLFRAILSRQLGEMDYTDEEALYPGGTFPEGEGYETEYHVLDFSQDPALTEHKQNKNYLEARFVAREIAALLASGFPVSDGRGGKRPVQPDDIAILLRSPGPVRHYYTMALEEQQVAWSAEGGEDFFQTTEISVALSWLQIIDNPRQDIPLLSVLRSPVCGFTPDRLAEIRGLGQGDFYTALQGAAEEGWEDCSAFLEDLEALRFGAGEKSSYALLWDLYRRTDLVEIFSAMPGGEKRRENLMAFYDLARRFEGAGHKGLFSFLLHLNRVQERGGVKTPPAAPQETAGVKLLSIHRSKGLEYPVVFLCGLGRQFNTTDLQQSGVLVHPKLGLGPKGVDGETRVKFSTLARTGVSLALKKELLAEEMRLLYVAMTRAKDKLILTHTLSRGKSDLEKAADGMGSPIAPQVLAGCTSPGQWVLLTAMARPEGQALRQGAGWTGGPVSAQGLGPAWRIEYHQGEVSQEVSRRVRQREAGEDLPPEELARELTWRYPYAVASATPAKVTATQVTQEVGEEPGVFLLGEKDREILFDRPQFAQETLGLTPAQRGTALHTAMQCVDLDRTGSQEELRRELDRLTRDKYLTPLQAQAVDVGAMARFFSSDLGRQLRQSPAARREYPFSLLAPARNFYPQAPEGEEILLQGVVDCWFETLEGITIVDFKTDRVSRAQALDRARSYAGQLAAYAYALEQITGKKVARKALWFLGPAIAVDL